MSKISSIVFETPNAVPFVATLEGKVGFKYFPIFDRIFFYKSTCTSSCIFSPIPPIEYTVTLTSSGKESSKQNVSLGIGEKMIIPVELIPSIYFRPLDRISLVDEVLGPNEIGMRQDGEILYIDTAAFPGETVIYSRDRNTPLFRKSFLTQFALFDLSRQFIILRGIRSEQYIISSDGKDTIIFPYDEDISLVTYANNTWKVLTDQGVYESRFDRWEKNLRFTDFIDMTPRYRIGYIDKNDSKKLALQNYPGGESLFLLFDRQTTQIDVVQKGKDIRGFLIHKGLPSILESDGMISALDISLE